MEEQKRENKEELQQETAEEKNSGQGNSSTRSSLLWIFAGGYLVYTGYRLCASVISGAEDSGVVFLALTTYRLLCDQAKEAKKICREFKPVFNKETYCQYIRDNFHENE